MILLHGDPRGFEEVVEEVQQWKLSLVEKEKEVYAFDHASISVALLEFWNIDPQISEAVLRHHQHDGESDPKSLRTILRMADYLCLKADFGFFSESSAPYPLLCAFGCDENSALEDLVRDLRAAYNEERLLFTTA